ncbi:uncharacterized protein YecE (DUF72 family) [Variovorax ginsengisoli]|uniref:Uncharacterized protein YecE (DUF72 family) n=1 Tax=Variovorax ginsengisoli TaxID=363844 RepID=A0ABT9SDP2_9BURK|nr:uncharacterized protein YecE (DUF72 family) [Variovorax ginsengisoli]
MLSTIEINGSFYSLQRPESYADWHVGTPDDFVFSVKGPRYITHLLQLRDVRVPLANFFASGILALGKKMGPVLWQPPPRMRFDAERMEEFLSMLPHDGKSWRMHMTSGSRAGHCSMRLGAQRSGMPWRSEIPPS